MKLDADAQKKIEAIARKAAVDQAGKKSAPLVEKKPAAGPQFTCPECGHMGAPSEFEG